MSLELETQTWGNIRGWIAEIPECASLVDRIDAACEGKRFGEVVTVTLAEAHERDGDLVFFDEPAVIRACLTEMGIEVGEDEFATN